MEAEYSQTTFSFVGWILTVRTLRMVQDLILHLLYVSSVDISKTQLRLGCIQRKSSINVSICRAISLYTRSHMDQEPSEIIGNSARAITLYEDHQSTITSAKDDRYQSRAKHIDIRHHFVREQVKLGNIEVNQMLVITSRERVLMV
ncbi:unnamed protein product [Albugo candida]|uniref:Uncharacterized protein n=1 Tax=Albugo candida TaxID=65357 RepID=A0A024G6I0_9STRA|nr:unnamed protein product [Albugo candida]|eukprot:CCI41895.1 unnamed protein product [Albugo candida]